MTLPRKSTNCFGSEFSQTPLVISGAGMPMPACAFETTAKAIRRVTRKRSTTGLCVDFDRDRVQSCFSGRKWILPFLRLQIAFPIGGTDDESIAASGGDVPVKAPQPPSIGRQDRSQ